jgi:hypothetical protein
MMAKKPKVVGKGRKKRKLGRNIGILAFFAIMVTVITLSALYQREQPTPKVTADKYFKFSDAGAWATPVDETNSSILITRMWFNITAVEGNARDVFILPPGMVDRDTAPQWTEIVQGKSEVVEVMFTHPVKSDKKNNMYPVSNFEVECREALGARVTINVSMFYLPPST